MDKEVKSLHKEKLTLKNKLFKDKEDLTEMFMNTPDIHDKNFIKMAYDLVCSYIEICQQRNKF